MDTQTARPNVCPDGSRSWALRPSPERPSRTARPQGPRRRLAGKVHGGSSCSAPLLSASRPPRRACVSVRPSRGLSLSASQPGRTEPRGLCCVGRAWSPDPAEGAGGHGCGGEATSTLVLRPRAAAPDGPCLGLCPLGVTLLTGQAPGWPPPEMEQVPRPPVHRPRRAGAGSGHRLSPRAAREERRPPGVGVGALSTPHPSLTARHPAGGAGGALSDQEREKPRGDCRPKGGVSFRSVGQGQSSKASWCLSGPGHICQRGTWVSSL